MRNLIVKFPLLHEALLDKKEIKIYSILKVDAGELVPSQSASVEITLDVEPEFDLPKYKEYELTVEPTDIKDEEIDKEIDLLCEQRASFDTVELMCGWRFCQMFL